MKKTNETEDITKTADKRKGATSYMVRKVIEVEDCLDAQSESKNNSNAYNRPHKNRSEKKAIQFQIKKQ